jgi:hypothetical protein
VKDMKEEISRPRNIALYKSLDSDWYTVDEVRFATFDEHYRPLPEGEAREKVMKGFVRVSEPVEVTFSQLGNDSIIQKAVESLDEAEREAIRELNAKIAAIREQKSQLLALTYQPEPVNG